MIRKLAPVLTIGVLGAAATAAVAAGISTGKYSGKTNQISHIAGPMFGKPLPIQFRIDKVKPRHGHSYLQISHVLTYTRDACPDGSHLQVTQNIFKSGKLDSHGKFSLRAGPRDQPAVLSGQVSGSKASGKLTDKSFDSTAGGFCTASATWSAKKQ